MRVKINRVSRTIKGNFVLLCIIVALSSTFSGPIWDTDFWWHLATGRFIAETKELPDTDPFTFTSGQQLTMDREVVLKGYWFAQIIFYLFYKLMGLYGIILLRTLLLTGIFILVYLWSRKKQGDEFVILFLILLNGWFSRYCTGERPQLFSFLFAPLMVFLLDQHREKSLLDESSSATYFLIPALMLIWANCHRGFPLGTAIMFIYWAVESIKGMRYKTALGNSHALRFTSLFFLTIGSSLINPNTYKPYITLLTSEGGALQSMTSEYVSPFYISQYGVATWPYWLYLSAVVIVFFAACRHIEATHMGITFFLAAISLISFRYIPFFMYATMPFTTIYATLLIKNWRKLNIARAGLKIPLLFLLMTFIIYMTVGGYQNALARTLKHPVMEYRFPVAAAEYIKRHSPRGNLLNNFEWGGYLIWELYPHYKVFIDGRSLNLQVFNDAMNMMWDIPQTPLLLEKYGINIIMIPSRDAFTGEYYTVVSHLIRDYRWRLAYSDSTALIFLR